MTKRVDQPRATPWLVLCVGAVAALCGCDRSGTTPVAPSSAPATQAATARQLPKVDASKLPEIVQQEIQIVRKKAQSPADIAAVMQLGALYLVHGFEKQAVNCFMMAATDAKDEMTPWYWLAIALEKSGDKENAAKSYSRATQVDANYGPAYVRLGRLVKETNPALAASAFEKALEKNPDYGVALTGLGSLLSLQGKHEEAIQRLQKAAALYPNYAEAHRALAAALLAVGRTEQANEHAKQGEGSGGEPQYDDPAWFGLLRKGLDVGIMINDALQLAQAREFDKALELLDIAVKVDKTRSVARNAVGAIKLMQEKFPEAEVEFRAALEADPTLRSAKVNLAEALFKQRRAEDAEKLYRELIATQADFGPMRRLAALLAITRRTEEAEATYRKAIELAPNDRTIHNEFAVFLSRMGKLEPALTEIRKHLELSPNDPQGRFMLANLLITSGKLVDAKSELQAVIAAAPTMFNAYRLLVSILISEGDVAGGKKVLTQGLEQNPEAESLANALAWILATTQSEKDRDPQTAITWAEKACKLTKNENYEMIDTLAAAYAAAGRFEDAVKSQKEAIRLATAAGVTDALPRYEERLKLFEEGKPYIEKESE